MVELQERNTQTKVKHEILNEYLRKWGFIITNGLKYSLKEYQKPKFRPRFVYVDYFSYLGAYTDNNSIVDGSPILGIKDLDEIRETYSGNIPGAAPATTTTILFEQETRNYHSLLEVLAGHGYSERIKRTDDLSSLRDGDIAVIKGDSSQYVDRILNFIDRVSHTYSFHFVDPYGTRGVEKRNLAKIVSKERADCIINMMLNPISRFVSVAAKDVLNQTEQAHANFLDRYFGSAIWREIGCSVAEGLITREQADSQLVAAFDELLQNSRNDLTVKQIPLKFQDREQTLYHLFLTTCDPTGAFTMNEILADARIREYDYRTEKRRMKEGKEPFPFMYDIPDQKRPTEPEPDIEFLADQIYAACNKREMLFRDVLRTMRHSAFFLKDVREALGKLKTKKRASFERAPSQLTNRTMIKFE